MSLQQGVNQLLGISAAALRLSPGFEKKAELKNIDKDIRALNKASKEDIEKHGAASVFGTKGTAITDPNQRSVEKARTERLVQHAELSAKRAKISPTAKFTKDAAFWQQRAMHEVQIKGQMKVLQKQEFEDLMDRLTGGKDGK